MGGYAAFVWPAYGIAAAVMGGLLLTSLRAAKARERDLAEIEARTGGRRRRGPAEEAAP